MRTDGDLLKMNPEEESKKRFDLMMKSDFGLFSKDGINFDVINFENNSIYHVWLTKHNKTHGTCDCPDFMNRCRVLGIDCKHMHFVKHYYRQYMASGQKVKDEVEDYFMKLLDKEND